MPIRLLKRWCRQRQECAQFERGSADAVNREHSTAADRLIFERAVVHKTPGHHLLAQLRYVDEVPGQKPLLRATESRKE